MALQGCVQTLRDVLSKDSAILTDEHDSKFKAAAERWANMSVQTPGAIVMPASEEDVVRTVGASGIICPPFVDNASLIGQRNPQSVCPVRSGIWRPQQLVDYWQRRAHRRSQPIQGCCNRQYQ